MPGLAGVLFFELEEYSTKQHLLLVTNKRLAHQDTMRLKTEIAKPNLKVHFLMVLT